jgi:hypothetical protein
LRLTYPWGRNSTEMKRVGIWVSGLIASAIPFVFVGAVIALLACIFDAVGEHAPPARSSTSFQPEQAVAVAAADAPNDVAQREPNKRQPSKHAHSDARHHHAPSRAHSRVRHSALVNQWGPVRRADPGLP